MQSHHISPHDQQRVSDTNIYAMPSHLTPWPTACEWHWHLCHAMQSHHISPHDQQDVSDTDICLYHAVSSHLTPWPTACEWHWHLFIPCSLITSHPMTNSLWVTLTPIYAMQSHHTSPNDQQRVSDTNIYAMPCSLITSHPMANRLWVTLTFMPCHAVSSHLIPRPTGCEWHWHLFMPCSLITSHPLTNRVWVTLTFICAMQSHHISPHDQQDVSDTDIYLWHAVSSHLTPWPTACEWHWHLCYAMQSHHISPHDQQHVSDSDIYLCHPVSLSHDQQYVSDSEIYLCHAVSSHLTPWPTGCEWHWHLFMPCSLITSHPMTNSVWASGNWPQKVKAW